MPRIEHEWEGKAIQKLKPDERYSVFIPTDRFGQEPNIGDRVLARGRRGAEWIGTIAAVRQRDAKGSWVVLAEAPPWINPTAAAKAERDALLALRHTKTCEQAGICIVCGQQIEPECPCVVEKRDKAAVRAKEKADAQAAVARDEAARAALAELDNLPIQTIQSIIEDADYDLQAAAEKLGLIEYRPVSVYRGRNGTQTILGTRRTVKHQLSAWMRRKKNAAWAPDAFRRTFKSGPGSNRPPKH